MPRTARLDVANTLYHVMGRGVARSDIFLTDGDRFDFMRRLAELHAPEDVTIFAFVLMNNHFHLVLRRGQRRLRSFMGRLLTGFAVTFNLRHERVGHLFQNRFKAIPCEEEAYLLDLVRYVHLNPVRAGWVTDPLQYRWSSHAAYVGRISLPWIDVETVLGLLGGRQRYCDFIAAGIGDTTPTAEKALVTLDLSRHPERPLGSESFASAICAAAGHVEIADQCIPTEAILRAVTVNVTRRTGITLGPGGSFGRSRTITRARAAFITEAVVVRRVRPIDVSRYLGISPSAVTRYLRAGDVL